MNEKDLKSKIYQQLDQLDADGLEVVKEMVSNYVKGYKIKADWKSLSEEDKAAIEEGIEQVEKGQTVPFEDVRRKLKTTLSQHDLSD